MLLLQGCRLEGDQGAVGAKGLQGVPGISCWDLNEDGLQTFPSEDLNLDGVIDVFDCRPTSVYEGDPAQRTWYVNSRELLRVIGDNSNDHYMPVYPYTQPGCEIVGEFGTDANVNCLADPFPDPCGLWVWDKTTSGTTQWYARAQKALAYKQYYLDSLIPAPPGGIPMWDGWTAAIAV